MQVTCPIEGHYNVPVIMICANPKCEKNRFLCLSCLSSTHNTCLNHLLHIDSILKKDFLLNQNWIQDKELRQVISFIEIKKPINSFDHLFSTVKAQLEKDCESLIQSFVEQINKAKEQYLSNLRELIDKSDINLDEFMSSFRDIYNFDSLIALIQQKPDGTESQRLDAFFKKCALDEQQNAYVQQKAKAFYSGIQKYITEITDKQPFKVFEEMIPYNKLTKIRSPINWSWDPSKMSAGLTLSENNMAVKKTNAENSNSTVLGSLALKEGCHKWGIEILDFNENFGTRIGIVELGLSDNLKDFPYESSICLTNSNFRYNMIGISELNDFKNKTLVCELDLDKGTFQISCDNVILAKEEKNLQNKMFIPFINLSHFGNNVRLHTYT